ncbi:MAG: hypothetical protein KA257_04820 [Opitutaceae bacterium]|nr:hypothetical protein [Opitutaceae bacterium]MBP9912298.1 hypothetical protein [Opitutaceae bacterium]
MPIFTFTASKPASAMRCHGGFGLSILAAVLFLLSGSGARAAGPSPATNPAAIAEHRDRVVELPPYGVEELLNPPWRYANVGGVEVISRCPDNITEQLIERHQRLHELLALFLPAQLRVRQDVPAAYVFYSERTQPPVSREIVQAMQERAINRAGNDAVRTATAVDVRFLPNYRFWDRDAMAVFYVVDEFNFGRSAISLTPGYVRYLLENRAPALPPWFIEGMMELYKGTAMPVSSGPGVRGSLGTALPAVTFAPVLWISEAETQALKKQPRRTIETVSLASLFAGALPAEADAAQDRVWRSQSVLFMRWALESAKVPSLRQSLWQFVEKAGTGPVNEAVFRECFGLSYAEVEHELGEYLPRAIRTGFTLHPAVLPELLEIKLRDATDAEISRIKGDLARMEIAYVRELYPELTAKYVEQARKSLRQSYDKGDRDPRLLAALGLCECDAGDDAAARPFLEAAVQAKVVRPRAYYELARINYAALHPADMAVELSAADVAGPLKLLAATRRQAPPLPEVYELIGEIWLRCKARLTPKQLAVLDEGIRYFPRQGRLIYMGAILNELNGASDRARELVAQGLRLTGRDAEPARFLKLKEAMRDAATLPEMPKLIIKSGRAGQDAGGREVPPAETISPPQPVSPPDVFPSIKVHFVLSGQNLFDTMADPILRAEVTRVESKGVGARMGLQAGDTLLSLNGAALRGRSIREVAALVAAGRKAGGLVWEVRRGATMVTLRYNGQWEDTLPASGNSP